MARPNRDPRDSPTCDRGVRPEGAVLADLDALDAAVDFGTPRFTQVEERGPPTWKRCCPRSTGCSPASDTPPPATSVLFSRDFGSLSPRVRFPRRSTRAAPAAPVRALGHEEDRPAGKRSGLREGNCSQGSAIELPREHSASPRADPYPTSDLAHPPSRTAPSFTPTREDTPRTHAPQAPNSREKRTEVAAKQHRTRGDTAPTHHTPISSQQIDNQRVAPKGPRDRRLWHPTEPATLEIGTRGRPLHHRYRSRQPLLDPTPHHRAFHQHKRRHSRHSRVRPHIEFGTRGRPRCHTYRTRAHTPTPGPLERPTPHEIRRPLSRDLATRPAGHARPGPRTNAPAPSRMTRARVRTARGDAAPAPSTWPAPGRRRSGSRTSRRAASSTRRSRR